MTNNCEHFASWARWNIPELTHFGNTWKQERLGLEWTGGEGGQQGGATGSWVGTFQGLEFSWGWNWHIVRSCIDWLTTFGFTQVRPVLLVGMLAAEGLKVVEKFRQFFVQVFSRWQTFVVLGDHQEVKQVGDVSWHGKTGGQRSSQLTPTRPE